LRLRLRAATVAAAEDLEIAAAGVHPFSSWQAQQRTAGERYDRMAEEYGRLARDEHNFGMHIHIAPPAGRDRVLLLSDVRRYIPHVLALSCSSPFYENEDSGYASYRMVLWVRRRRRDCAVRPSTAATSICCGARACCRTNAVSTG
jgi:glutamate---cysteine ligase / carboxylate-amine ligase